MARRIGRLLGCLLLGGLLLLMPAVFDEQLVFGDQLVDRIVAAVDDDPIFLSDIERVIRLGLNEAQDGEGTDDLRRRILDDLIEQRLRLHEVERFGASNIPAEKVERQMAILRQGLDEGEEGLRHLVTRQLRVLIYIEERLRARVFVDLEDIRRYHETELKAEMERAGSELPPLAEVEALIRAVLVERRLNEEIEAWTHGLRQAAEIVDHFDGDTEEPPPVVLRLEVER